MRFIYLSLIYVLFLGRHASAELRCPEGSAQFERKEDDLRYQWCARPSGEKHGVWVILNQFNHVIEVGWMIEGERHGEWRWRRQDGSLKTVGWYEMGEPVGRWTSWSANGKIVGAIQHHAAERWPLWLEVEGPRDRQPWVVWQRQIPIPKSVWVERIGGIAVVGTRDAGGVGFIDPI